jgi:hexulose-6-phosphate isomerase
MVKAINKVAIKKGIDIFSFDPGLCILDCMKIAKRAGFEGIELAVGLDSELNFKTSDEYLMKIKEDAKRVGIKINGIVSGLYFQYSITSDQPRIRKKAEELIKRQVYVASKLGVDNVLVCAGAVGVDFQPTDVVPDTRKIDFFVGSEIIDYDVCYERAVSSFKKVSGYAEDLSVCICVENIWNKFLISPIEMRSFIDDIDSTVVASYFDVGNCMAFGYPEQWIKILNKRIKMVHFKDYRRAVGSLAGFVDILAGDVDWPKVMQALKQIGYEGWVTAEMCPVYKHYSDQIVYNTSAAMDRIIGGK